MGFSQPIQMIDQYTTNSPYLTYTSLFKRLGECTSEELLTWASQNHRKAGTDRRHQRLNRELPGGLGRAAKLQLERRLKCLRRNGHEVNTSRFLWRHLNIFSTANVRFYMPNFWGYLLGVEKTLNYALLSTSWGSKQKLHPDPLIWESTPTPPLELTPTLTQPNHLREAGQERVVNIIKLGHSADNADKCFPRGRLCSIFSIF